MNSLILKIMHRMKQNERQGESRVRENFMHGLVGEVKPVRRRGFTLIELLVVVAIIGILVSILVPSLNKAKEKALLAVCISNQSQLSKRVFMYAKDEKENIPPYNKDGSNIDNGHNTRYFYYSGSWSSRRNLAYMWNSPDEVDFGEALFCPAMKNEIYQYKTYAPFPTAGAPAWSGWSSRIRLSYNYNTWRKDDSTWEPRYSNISEFDDEMIMTTDLFTEASQMKNKTDILSHSAINSMSVGKGDGSVKIKVSKGLMATIRMKDWESRSDLNQMSQLLISP